MAEITVPLSQPSASRAKHYVLPVEYWLKFSSQTLRQEIHPNVELAMKRFSWQVAEDFNNKSWEILADLVEDHRSQNFGNLDWSKLIAPGEIRFCGCGIYLLPQGATICGYCLYKPSLEDHLCGICGKQADMMFVHGFRCDEHKFVTLPSQGFTGTHVCGTIGRLRPNYPHQEASMAQASTSRHHNRLKALRDALAIHRLKAGYEATFWMKQPDLRSQAIKRLSMSFGAPPVTIDNEPDPIPAILELLKS